MDSTPITRAEFTSYLTDMRNLGVRSELSILSLARMRTTHAKYRYQDVRELLHLTTSEDGMSWDAPVDECNRYGWMPSYWVGEHGKEKMKTLKLAELYDVGDILDPATLHAIALRRGEVPNYDYARQYVISTLKRVYDILAAADPKHKPTTTPEWYVDGGQESDKLVDSNKAQLVRAWVEGYDPLGDSVPRGGMPTDEQGTWERYDGYDEKEENMIAETTSYTFTALQGAYVKYAGVPRK